MSKDDDSQEDSSWMALYRLLMILVINWTSWKILIPDTYWQRLVTLSVIIWADGKFLIPLISDDEK